MLYKEHMSPTRGRSIQLHRKYGTCTMYIIHRCTIYHTFLVVEEAIVPHEHPVVVEGGRSAAGMEHRGMVLEEVLEGLQVARISLRREGGCMGRRKRWGKEERE